MQGDAIIPVNAGESVEVLAVSQGVGWMPSYRDMTDMGMTGACRD
jgi:hypothetical protein